MPTFTGTPGDDIVDYLAGTTAIDLRAGNDLLTLHPMNGVPLTVTTGAGRDVIRYATDVGTSIAQVTITDFQTGVSGDRIDLMPFLDNYLAAVPNLAWVWGVGDDPFVSGHLVLRQSGADTILVVRPFGHDDVADSTLIRFSNTAVAAFTSANFDGLNPHAVITNTIIVTDDYSFAADATFNLTNPALGRFTSLFGERVGIFLEDFTSQPSVVANHATISVSREAALHAGELFGFAISRYGGTDSRSTFLNAADGSFIVSDPMSSQADIFDQTIGFYAPQQGITFLNEGHFEVRGTSGKTYGIKLLGGVAGPFATPVNNSGAFIVDGGRIAYGIYAQDASNFINSGDISVRGGLTATGIFWNVNFGADFVNHGTITVATDQASPYASIGVFSGDFFDGINSPHRFFNDGTITADIAIRVWDFRQNNRIPDSVVNQGVIDGAVMLSYGDDVVQNSGTMRGATLLGADNDQYLGGAGRHEGYVDGEQGNDILTGGAFSDALYGGAGNDVVSGGGGEDIIDGGLGNDVLDGGSGVDTLSYAESLLAVSVNLATGRASDGQSIDTLTGFEDVIGSRFDDVLVGSEHADNLAGFSGNDRIDGGFGDDVLFGDAGDDDLTGGKGNDVFVFTAGDGADTIRDFTAADDAVDIYGYTGPVSLTQSGADVRLVLSATDSILFRNASLSRVQGAISYVAQPLAGYAPVVDPTLLVLNDYFLLSPGSAITLTNPSPIYSGEEYFQGVGIIFGSTGSIPHFTNGGTVEMIDTVAGQRAIAVQLDAGSWWERTLDIDNLPTGVISVHAVADAVGVFTPHHLDNYGLIRAVSDHGSAVAVTDMDYDSVVYNAGTLDVSAAGLAIGIGQVLGSSNSTNHLWNDGVITVHGGGGSRGIDYIGGARIDAPPAQVVNSGTILATDTSSARDSGGIVVDWSGHLEIFNSGIIQGDYAIRYERGYSGGYVDDTITIYNSGSLLGGINLDYHDPSNSRFDPTDPRRTIVVNSGTITGGVTLHSGDDLYDGRLGQLSGPLFGMAGNDRLIAGAGAQSIDGGAGNDFLSGGTGNDLLTGGAGADIFRFESGFGTDTVTDFDPGGGDRIEVRGYTAWTGLTQAGGDVIVRFSATDALVLAGQSLANISTANFIFGAAAVATTPVPVAPAPPPPAPVQLDGTAGADILTGFGIVNTINGFDGNDQLTGGAHADTLNGGNGDDILAGGLGTDLLIGGPGRDNFTGTAAGFSGDTIADLRVGDRLVFTDAGQGFGFALNGTTLSYTGGSLTLSAPPTGRLAAASLPGGGIELSVRPATSNDFNGDGRSDILWRNGEGLLGNWLGDASGYFAVNGAVPLKNVPNDWHVTATGDFNGDGRSDILWRNDSGALGDWLGTATGDFTVNPQLVNVSTDWKVAGSGDFDGDGRSDILWRNDNGVVGDWLGTASGNFSINSSSLVSVPTAWKIAGVGDFNGDGRSDILWRNDDGTIGNWLGNASGGFAFNPASVAIVPNEWKIAGVGDFNGDGRSDILWRNAGGAVGDWLGTASGGYTVNAALTQVPNEWHVAATGDYNGDGRDDILWRSDSGALGDWLGTASGNFAVNSGLYQVPTAWHVQPEMLV